MNETCHNSVFPGASEWQVPALIRESSDLDQQKLQILATCTSKQIRMAVALHANTCEKTLALLSNDQDNDVRDSILIRNLPKEWHVDRVQVLWRMLREDENVKPEILEILACSNDEITRILVAKNRGINKSTKDRLANDRSDRVREALLYDPEARLCNYVVKKLASQSSGGFSQNKESNIMADTPDFCSFSIIKKCMSISENGVSGSVERVASELNRLGLSGFRSDLIDASNGNEDVIDELISSMLDRTIDFADCDYTPCNEVQADQICVENVDLHDENGIICFNASYLYKNIPCNKAEFVEYIADYVEDLARRKLNISEDVLRFYGLNCAYDYEVEYEYNVVE